MKYLEIVMALMMINLTVGLFSQTGLLPNELETDVLTESPVDVNGNFLDPESLGYKVYNFKNEKYYLNSAQNLDQQYLQSGGDFLRGLFWFLDAFVKGTVLAHVTLENFHVPIQIIYYFVTPLYLIYAIAIIQLISGRSFGGNE